MALELVTGYWGQNHVTAEQEADLNAGIFGSGFYVLPVGEKMRAEAVTSNQVRIFDGIFVGYGRQASIEEGGYENVMIENGTAGLLRNDMIVIKYNKDEESGIESVAFDVLKGQTGSTAQDPVPNNQDIRAGAFESEMPLYRVRLNGLAIEEIEPLFTVPKSIEELMQENAALNSALADFRNAEALHIETITESKSYTLDKSISDYKLIEIIMQYGSSNWITTRLFRPSTLSQFPNIMDSAKTSLLECYYNMYINGKSVNIGAISNNTRILIRGIK